MSRTHVSRKLEVRTQIFHYEAKVLTTVLSRVVYLLFVTIGGRTEEFLITAVFPPFPKKVNVSTDSK